MKQFHSLPSILSLLLIFTFTSCYSLYNYSLVNYVGDRYPPTSTVDVYYAVKDIQREYTIIGRMTRELVYGDPEKREMIEVAKRNGAEGIIFYDLETDAGKSTLVSIKAEVFRYK
jgi:hypothetical protein